MEASSKALREALLLVSRVAAEMTRGTTTGEVPTREEVDSWAMELCSIIDAAAVHCQAQAKSMQSLGSASHVRTSSQMGARFVDAQTTKSGKKVTMEANSKLRESMVQVKEIARTICSTSEKGSHHEDLADKIVEIANAALAAPPRNCDLGTTEEQYKRFKKFCFDNMGDGMNEDRCSKCLLYKTKSSCKFDWAQMPCNGGETNGNQP